MRTKYLRADEQKKTPSSLQKSSIEHIIALHYSAPGPFPGPSSVDAGHTVVFPILGFGGPGCASPHQSSPYLQLWEKPAAVAPPAMSLATP